MNQIPFKDQNFCVLSDVTLYMFSVNPTAMMIAVPQGLIPLITGCTPAFDNAPLSGTVSNTEGWVGTGSGKLGGMIGIVLSFIHLENSNET